jgi:hypothetical protein
LKLEVGKTYLTRDGQRVFIDRFNGLDKVYPFRGTIIGKEGNVPADYCSDGRYAGQNIEHTCDIVSEYTEPKSDWEANKSRKPLLVNLYGAPGSGKTSGSLYLTGLLKSEGYKAAYVEEFASQLIRQGLGEKLGDWKNQNYIVTGQVKLILDEIAAGSEIIICDSPPTLNILHYSKLACEKAGKGSEFTESMITSQYIIYNQIFSEFDKIDVYVKRVKPFLQWKRVHSEEQSNEMVKPLKFVYLTSNLESQKVEITGDLKGYNTLAQLIKETI